MSYQPRIESLKRKLHETKAYISLRCPTDSQQKKRAPAAAQAALEEACVVLDSSQKEVADLQRICEALCKSIAARKKTEVPEVRILHYYSIKVAANCGT